MANICVYEMLITGPSGAAALELANELGDMGRFYEARVIDEWGAEQRVFIEGDCAWSLWAALGLGQRDCPFRAEAGRLGITLEAYSEETDTGFQEHIVIKNGELTVYEACDFYNPYIAEADEAEWQDLCELHGFASVEEAKQYADDTGEYLLIGGFDWSYPGEAQEPRHGFKVTREES